MLLTFILACLRMALVIRTSTSYQRKQKPVYIFLLLAELSPKLLVKFINSNVKISQDASQHFPELCPLCSSWATFTEFNLCHSTPGIHTTDCIILCRFQLQTMYIKCLKQQALFQTVLEARNIQDQCITGSVVSTLQVFRYLSSATFTQLTGFIHPVSLLTRPLTHLWGFCYVLITPHRPHHQVHWDLYLNLKRAQTYILSMK